MATQIAFGKEPIRRLTDELGLNEGAEIQIDLQLRKPETIKLLAPVKFNSTVKAVGFKGNHVTKEITEIHHDKSSGEIIFKTPKRSYNVKIINPVLVPQKES